MGVSLGNGALATENVTSPGNAPLDGLVINSWSLGAGATGLATVSVISLGTVLELLVSQQG